MTPKPKRKPKAPGKPRPNIYGWIMANGLLSLNSFATLCDSPKARNIAAYLLKYADWADAQAARRKGKGE